MGAVRYVLIAEPGGRLRGIAPPEVDLTPVGRLSVRRLSTVEFDEAQQGWVIRPRDGSEIPGGPWATKALAIEAEVAHFGARLLRGEDL